MGDGSLLGPVRQGYYCRGYGSGEGGFTAVATTIDGELGSDVFCGAQASSLRRQGTRGYGHVVVDRALPADG